MQRTDEREPEVESADRVLDRERADAGRAFPSASSSTPSESSGVRARLRERARRVFSVRAFLVALALAVGTFLIAGVALPFESVAGLVGVFAVGFALGLAGWRRYVEVALAGAATAGVGMVLQDLFLSFLAGLAPAGVLGAGTGLLAAVVGHYLGRDLRDGLTREL